MPEVKERETYGSQIKKALEQTDSQEVGDVMEYLGKYITEMITEIVQKQHESNPVKDYYIHLIYLKEGRVANSIRFRPLCRITRPSPYICSDHILYKVTDFCNVSYQWSVSSPELRRYINANPAKFDKHTVEISKAYDQDKLEKLDDYLVDGKIE